MSLAVLADHMASKGRGPDSMLIHMSPREVQGLQALAMKNGGSLTINPETGLPEAGFLDKLLPAIIGFALAPMTAGTSLAFLGATPMASALTVGGLQALRTGDIGKGIQAGLGAYGGAGLQAGLATAGTSAIGGEAAKAASGLTGDMAYNLADAGSSLSNALAGGETGILDSSALSNEAIKGIQQQAAANAVEAASPFDKLSRGFDAAKANPSSLLTKDNFKYMAAAAAPVLADQAVKSNLPTTTTKPGMIRPYSFDPYGGTYTAGTPYEAQAKKAAGGGLMGMNDGGYNPGRLNFTGGGEPVVRMAEGGVAHFANGGDAALAAYQSGNYAEANRLLGEAGMSAQDVVSKYGLSQADAAAVAKNLGYAGDMSGIQYAAAPTAAAPVIQAAAAVAPAYNQYTNEQIGSYLTTNPNVDLATAIKTTNADPTAVNAYLASIADPFRGSTDTTGGSGVLGIYNQMKAQGIDPTELYRAEIANDPKYAGYTQPMIQKAYDLSKGAYSLSDAKKGVVSDKDWVKFMDDNKYSIDDAAQAFGLSRNEVKSRYDAVKAAETKTQNPIVCGPGMELNAAGTACVPKKVVDIFNPPVTGGGTTIIPGVNDYGLGGTGTSGRLESIYGPALPPGVSGAGITTVNPNGTITTRPNIPGIPEGGFTGMTSLRDAYEKGGGSLGVNKNLFAPKTQDELFARYKNTGGSKAALDYLMGKIPYSPVPVTPTGEIMKPYWESVGRFPAQDKNKNKKYIYDGTKYVLNPDYVKPSYVLAGEKAAALTNQDKEPTESPGAGNKWTWNSVDKKWEAKPISAAADTNNQLDSSSTGGEANGGLMAMAGGGMAGQFDLGGYSDGGRLLRGPGDGVSDSIPATIGNKRPARLADGEFVVPARIVSELGNGSTEAGARKLYAMMDRVQKARRGTVGKGRVAKNSRSDKYLPA